MKTRLYFVLVALLSSPIFASENQAITAFENKELDVAESLFKKQVKDKEKKNQALVYLGRIKLQQNELDDAEEYFEESIDLEPNDADEYYWYGAVMGSQAQAASIFSKASYAKSTLKYFKKAVELDNSHLPALKGLISYYLQAPSFMGGSEEEAVKIAIFIEKVDPTEGAIAQLNIALTQEDTAKTNQALAHIQANFKQSVKANLIAGNQYQKQEKWPQAFEAFQTAELASAKDDKEKQSQMYATYQIGRTSVLSKSELQLGIDALTRYQSFEITGNNPPKPWAQVRQAELYLLQNNKQKTKELLTPLLKSKDNELKKKAKKLYRKVK